MLNPASDMKHRHENVIAKAKTGLFISFLYLVSLSLSLSIHLQKMPIFNLMYLATTTSHKYLCFTLRRLLVTLLISSLLIELNAYAHDTESSLGTYMTKNPESTDAPEGDEVQFTCELNLPPEKFEWYHRRDNSLDQRDELIETHLMVSCCCCCCCPQTKNKLLTFSYLNSRATTSRPRIEYRSYKSTSTPKRLASIVALHGSACRLTRRSPPSCGWQRSPWRLARKCCGQLEWSIGMLRQETA